MKKTCLPGPSVWLYLKALNHWAVDPVIYWKCFVFTLVTKTEALM